MRVVVDTNVLVSGLLWHGAPHRLIELATHDAFQIVISTALLEEFERVIERRKFQGILTRSRVDAARVIRYLHRIADLVEVPALQPRVSRDADDDKVLALAVAADADFVVTGDDDLLSLRRYAGIPIVDPTEALRLLASLQ